MRLKIGIDWDDVTATFNSEAIKLANEEQNIVPPLQLEEITSWENNGRADVIKKYYKDIRLYESQVVTEEVKRAIRELEDFADIYFVTAVYPDFMGVRAAQIKKEFPEFRDDRIILGAAKNLINFDVILDDNSSNVINSPARFKVLYRRPWNRKVSGFLAVTNMPDFVTLVKHITDSNGQPVEKPKVVALVGPSGVGKNAVANAICENSTSNKRLITYSIGDIDETANRKKCNSLGEEYSIRTSYAGKQYGILESDVNALLSAGYNVVVPLDMCGAITMKAKWPTLIVYLGREKSKIVQSIIASKRFSEEEKVLRIMSIEAEQNNASLCNLLIDMDCTSAGCAAEKIKKFI